MLLLVILVLLACLLGAAFSLGPYIGSFFVIRDTVKRSGDFGINTQPTSCPRCGNTDSPAMRRPTNMRQALWGGYTCSKCGCERDKWGNEIAS